MASGRLGQSSGNQSVSLRFDASRLLRLVDQVSGNFRSGKFYGALTAANDQAAVIVQQGMADELHRRIGRRPQRPGERLANAILNEKNREVFANTFSVGIERWMDRSPAKLYWRRIEEGDPNTFSARILFFTPGGGFSKPYAGQGPGRDQRMPQFYDGRGVFVQGIGPFPALHYSYGAQEAFNGIDMSDRYITELKAVGITATKGVFR